MSVTIKKKGTKGEYTVHIPPNALKAKVGNGGFSEAIMEKATEVVATHEISFREKMALLVKDLEEICQQITHISDNQDQSLSPELHKKTYTLAHELKGEGATFGHPIISTICNSLCFYFDKNKNKSRESFVVKAHLETLLIIIKQGIKTEETKIAQELSASLQKLVEKTLKEA